MNEQFIIPPTPSPEAEAAAIICGHDVIQALGEDGMCDFHGFVQEVLATTIMSDRSVAVPRAQYEAYVMAAKALDQCVSDFNAFPDGKCVCQQAKEEAIEALAALRAAGCLEDGE